jgi:MerR family transcriptional regulator, light-induced transcriptional regulator
VAVYSIKDLEKLSGIKAHTIRVWEQRYGLIQPSRTKTNIRFYEDSELKLLLNIALLNKKGIKISRIAEMKREEISEKIVATADINLEYDTQLDALSIAMIEMDETKFDQVLDASVRGVGFERTMLDVIYPFLDRFSMLWLTGTIKPVQERFMSQLLQRKVIAAIENEPLATAKEGKRFLLFLPEGENQALSLLFMHFLLKARRHTVLYLGEDASLEDVEDGISIYRPDYVFTLINEGNLRMPLQRYINALSKSCLEGCQLLLSGFQMVQQSIESPDNTTVLYSLDDTVEFVENQFPKARRQLNNKSNH